MMRPAKRSPSGILVRPMQFDYPADLDPHWNPARPEFSHVGNATSLVLPYLEPYLIDVLREARPLVKNPLVADEIDGFIGQEANHFKQHRKLNELLVKKGYACVRAVEREIERDYDEFRKRPLRFGLAYAAGFETLTLCMAHLQVVEREYLFKGADPNVAALAFWHLVEEIEHKNATFDVYQEVVGSYPYRVYGLLYASTHLMRRIRQGYVALLKQDGVWGAWRTRWELKKLFGRVFSFVLPMAIRHALPRYHPRQEIDPQWVREWIEAYDRGDERLRRLDTRAIERPFGELLAASG